MPENSTNLTFAGIIKWILLICSLPCFVKAYQGIVARFTSTGGGRYSSGGTVLYGDEALKFGLQSLLTGVLFIAAAWAVWYFWQQNED